MAYSTVQRVALASGLVLALSLLLPKAFLSRGKRQEPPPTPEGKLGRFPPMMHHHQVPTGGQTPGARFQRSHLAEAFAKAKGSGGGAGGGSSGRGLMGQIIPIYGFGIFLYILYILFKLSKGKTTAEDGGKCSTATPGNTHRKISYPEETYPIYDLSECIKRRQETILVDYPDPKELSAEETAERMGVIEEEESDHLGWESLPTDPRAQEDNSVTSCDPKPETCSCCLHEDEDPAVLAENAGFNADSYLGQEETTKEEWSQDFRDEGLGINIDKAYTGSTLRKRNPQGLE
ncbi:PREDICTED: protein RIC-3 isoform X4 [Colobus angolensis palliatus]|uniref:Resistance to inhibitors of cholinesterase protein 3 N-terminal domain-containing protein n=1 Tax=Colobus angolensis palliatus TaxID=336983 RepID=A0A2K5JQ87_COLAP|nr:PREDICTED: protein RIC-3 isoform X4 [Colobus angolensis palliatus]